MQYCYVRAPFDAYVTNLNIAVGQYANEGRQVVSLVDNRQWYVMANFRENFLDHIRPGMRVEVYLLSYPNRRFVGRVQEAGWALHQENGATVAGLPQVEPTLNWVRLSQRFPVRIVIENRRSATSVPDGPDGGRHGPGLPLSAAAHLLRGLQAVETRLDSFLSFLGEELSPRPGRLRASIRIALITALGAGLMAAMHIDSELGVYLLWSSSPLRPR